MPAEDAQKSEVHHTTADADGSPAAAGDRKATRQVGTDASRQTPKVIPEPPSPNTQIIRDDSDAGGPITILSDDPDLIPPKPPVDPFPTERTPEIDPPRPPAKPS